MRLASVLAGIVSLALAANVFDAQTGPDDPDSIRRELTAMNAAWSAVRLAYDRVAADTLIVPTFYAALRDRSATRQEFITAVSTRSPTSKLVRFDNPILTIMKGESANEWVALVLEKLEYDRKAPDGNDHPRVFALDHARRIPARRARTMEVHVHAGSDARVVDRRAKPPFTDWDRRE